VVLEALGRFDEAAVDYRSVLEVQPDDPAAWNNLGNASAGENAPLPWLMWTVQRGECRAALKSSLSFPSLGPPFPRSRTLELSTHPGMGNWDDARFNYDRAAQLAPNFSFAAANLALADYELGYKNDAIKSMRNLLRRWGGGAGREEKVEGRRLSLMGCP
jgi:tetratricopeptide (TPR) repeat protein